LVLLLVVHLFRKTQVSVFVHLADGMQDANVAALRAALPGLQVVPTVAQQEKTAVNRDLTFG